MPYFYCCADSHEEHWIEKYKFGRKNVHVPDLDERHWKSFRKFQRQREVLLQIIDATKQLDKFVNIICLPGPLSF